MLELAWQLYITGKHKMGRYISTGSAQPNTCTFVGQSVCYQVQTHKYAYDANECWPNRVIIDTPGSYTFTLPAGATCLRTIAVGGGGKSKCNPNCRGSAGSGGGYAEKFDAVAAGCTVTIVVGRQEQDTTIAYTNTGAVARTITGGGAAGCVAGVASGGDWNSSGGCAGQNCNYCGGGNISHYCGACIYQYATTCCGYCVVWAGISARSIDPNHQGDDCCQARYAGGGSAGSWIWSTGGAGQGAYNSVPVFSLGYGSTAGGGGGIGYITRQPIRSSYCTCVCMKTGYNGHCYGICLRNMNQSASAGGGGGTKWQCITSKECLNATGFCQAGRMKSGEGGWGGKNNNEGRPYEWYWGWSEAPNSHGDGWWVERPQGPSPCQYTWHDIHDMKGSGSAGRAVYANNYYNTPSWANGVLECMPDNSGEGAGTGGVTYYCCSWDTVFGCCCQNGADACGTVNWTLLCCLGTSGAICCADKLQTHLFPYIVACAGTLGGAGGFGVCHGAQKAGKGGGSGVNRSYILCVCYGGSFNLCNGSGAALAFPPSELDWRVSTAGTGMAIIYWK